MEQKQNTQTPPPRIWTTVGMNSDLDYFLENMSMLIGSGMSILSAFDAIEKNVATQRMKKIVAWMRAEVEGGTSLSHVLEEVNVFPSHATSLIAIGEQSGRLSENIKLVSAQQKKERMFRSEIKTALMYPVFVLSLTVIVGVGIAWFILPRLANVFAQLRFELPALTKALITSGEFLSAYGIIAIPAFVFTLILFVYFLFFFPKTKFIGQTILFHFPGTKRLIQQVEIARFSYLLSTLLDAGLPIVRTIESLADAATFPQYKKFYTHLAKRIKEGNSFEKSFHSFSSIDTLFPVPVQQMVIAGEKSGKLPESLSDVNESYEAKVENTTKNLTVILEPVLLVIVWIGVVAVALAVIMPIYNLVGGFNRGGISPQNQSTPPVEQTTTEDQDMSDTATTTTATTTPASDAPENQSTRELRILPTGFGYLNVRAAPTTATNTVGRVIPGETYIYQKSQQGWYEIILSNDSKGWVYGEYVEIQ